MIQYLQHIPLNIEDYSISTATYIGTRPENQDVVFYLKKPNNYYSIGILDGHGPYGLTVAKDTANMFLSELNNSTKIEEYKKLIELYNNSYNNNIIFDFFMELYNKIDSNLLNYIPYINNSGTTCTLLFYLPIIKKLIITSVGDSRAIICNKGGFLYRLTTDHHFTNNLECYNTLKNSNGNGLIDIKNDGVKRIWLTDKGFKELGITSNYDTPGLMISRTIGDYYAKIAGCSSIPDINILEITDENKFIIVASDGLWDFLTDQEACNITNKFYNVSNRNKKWTEDACKELITYAYNKSNKIILDNITVIIMEL